MYQLKCGSILKKEDEWKEFEEEKKDYSGLKIQNMQLNDSADAGGQGGDDDGSDDGEGGEGGRGRKAAGPWKMPVNAEGKENDSEEEEEEAQPVGECICFGMWCLFRDQ